jgi:predicted AAA+ superfamily ATPase
MLKREFYLKRLVAWKDSAELIKVITGVRRCGKSSLLELFGEYLVRDGVPPVSILKINLESMEYSDLNNARSLHDFIKKNKAKKGKTYVLLDEVQMADEWERAVNSLRLDKSMDIYITGSNTYMLNSKLATLLSGRYIEIRMLPLSFGEFIAFNQALLKSRGARGNGSVTRKKGAAAPIKSRQEYFDEYLSHGGFPGLFSLDQNRRGETTLENEYLSGIYNTIVVTDIIKMNQIRDGDILEKILLFLADNIGNIVSAKKIADYVTSTGRKTSSDTADNYLKMLENAYLFYRARRNDIKGKHLMKTNDKFFIVDLGLRNFLKGRKSDYGSTLENVVYFELLRRGYDVNVGKLDSLEVDFVAHKPGLAAGMRSSEGSPQEEQVYIQVTSSLAEEKVRERELLPLRKIPDNYKKVILSLDPVGPFTDIDGMLHYNLVEWLTP